MKKLAHQCPTASSAAGLVGWACLLLLLAGADALALTPESPQVKAAINRGLNALARDARQDGRTGAQALAGLAFVKNGADDTHPIVQGAVARIRGALQGRPDHYNDGEQIYHLGLSVIFLASLDGEKYRPEIDALMQRLLAAQKRNGGWGYPGGDQGDTSMTQYGVLSLWEAQRVGISSPLVHWEAVANWLLRTQDPSGGFGYQGIDPGNFNRVQQQDVRQSLSAAGLGSLYVCYDHFDFGGRQSADEPEGKKLPSALKSVRAENDRRVRRRPNTVDAGRLRAAIDLGDRWFAKNYTKKPEQWFHYSLYAYERYRSFQEAAAGTSDNEPRWYTEIAEVLLAEQAADGSWEGLGGKVPDTAFSLLFLLRSTKKSIQATTLGSGTLVGGRGLPKNLSEVDMRLGSVVPRRLSGPADELLAVMEDPNHPDFLRAVEGFGQEPLGPDDALLPEHVVRLRKLAGGDSPAARAAALRALAKTRELDHVPLLIHALEDPDWTVVKEARDGLRYVSRKFHGFGMPIPATEPQRREAIDNWRAWYRSIRPEYEFED